MRAHVAHCCGSILREFFVAGLPDRRYFSTTDFSDVGIVDLQLPPVPAPMHGPIRPATFLLRLLPIE